MILEIVSKLRESHSELSRESVKSQLLSQPEANRFVYQSPLTISSIGLGTSQLIQAQASNANTNNNTDDDDIETSASELNEAQIDTNETEDDDSELSTENDSNDSVSCKKQDCSDIIQASDVQLPTNDNSDPINQQQQQASGNQYQEIDIIKQPIGESDPTNDNPFINSQENNDDDNFVHPPQTYKQTSNSSYSSSLNYISTWMYLLIIACVASLSAACFCWKSKFDDDDDEDDRL